MRVLPLPASALLTVLELDFLHGSDELIGLVVVDSLLLEQLIVKHLAPAEKQGYPGTIQETAEKENGKHELVVEEQHN